MEAMTKWMDSQGTTWDRWDHLYSQANAKVDGQLKCIDIPLSSSVFLTLMRKCSTKVSTQLEESRQSKIQDDAKKLKDDKARRAAVNEATSLPRQAADKRIEDKMDEKLQPLLEKIRSQEEQLRKNVAAPTAADQDGADARSAKKKSARHQSDREQRKVRKPPRKGRGGSADRQRSRCRDPQLYREPEVQAVKETVQKGQSPTA